MRRLILALLLTLGSTSGGTAEVVRVVSWNLQWFPGGQRNLVGPEVEETRIQAAAEFLRNLDSEVLLLQGMRDLQVCERLSRALGGETYHVLTCSEFGDADGPEQSRLQLAILSKRRSDAAWNESWKPENHVELPRGYAFAAVRFGTHVVGFYNLHLKSNLSATRSELGQQINMLKRELAVEQLLRHIRSTDQKTRNGLPLVVIGGTFNTGLDGEQFVSERTLRLLDAAGFQNPLATLAPDDRVTYRSGVRYPASTLDYIVVRNGIVAGQPRVATSPLSDHAAVVCELNLPGSATPAAPVSVVSNQAPSRASTSELQTATATPRAEPAAAPVPPAAIPDTAVAAQPIANAPAADAAPAWIAPLTTPPATTNRSNLWILGLALVSVFHLAAFIVLALTKRRGIRAPLPVVESPLPPGDESRESVSAEPALGHAKTLATAAALPQRSPWAGSVPVHLQASHQATHPKAGSRAGGAKHELVRTALLPHLARLMKDRLVGALLAQRAHLMRTQESGTEQVAELEQRLVTIQTQLQERYQDYEQRIHALEQRLAAKEAENRTLRQALSTPSQATPATPVRRGPRLQPR
jgi:endonuclease/exonuclease/phosphatase family metal-dependent hydrolase